MSENDDTIKKLEEIEDMLVDIGNSIKINSAAHGLQLKAVIGLLVEIRNELKKK